MNYRKEHDALGEVLVPESCYYGAQTARAISNFDISDETTNQYRSYIHAVVKIKKAAALAHKDLGVLAPDVADGLVKAADEVLAGALSDQFPINVLQGGGGTSTNMNVNEVLSNRANEILTGQHILAHYPSGFTHAERCTASVDPDILESGNIVF